MNEHKCGCVTKMENLMKCAILLFFISFVSLFVPNYVPSPVVFVPNITSYLGSFGAICSVVFSSISLILCILIVVGVVSRMSTKDLYIYGPLFFAIVCLILLITLSPLPIDGDSIRYGVFVSVIGFFPLVLILGFVGVVVKYAIVKLWKKNTNTGMLYYIALC